MEPTREKPWHVLHGFLVGVGVWILGFAMQFLMVMALNFAKLSFAICPLVLVAFGVHFFRRRRERPAYTAGVLISICLAILISSACGVQIAIQGFSG